MATYDPYYTSVEALLHCDGLDGASVFTNQKSTSFSSNGNAQIDTAVYKYGTASGLFDGTGDYVSASNAVLNMSSTDWTVECYARFDSLANDPAVWMNGTTGSNLNRIQLSVEPDGTMWLYGYGASSYAFWIRTAEGTISIDTMYEICASRVSNVVYLFLDGVLVGAEIVATEPSCPNDFYIGTARTDDTARYMDGWIDEFRLTIGVGRHSASYTANSEAFPDLGGTNVIVAPLDLTPQVTNLQPDRFDLSNATLDLTPKATPGVYSLTQSVEALELTEIAAPGVYVGPVTRKELELTAYNTIFFSTLNVATKSLVLTPKVVPGLYTGAVTKKTLELTPKATVFQRIIPVVSKALELDTQTVLLQPSRFPITSGDIELTPKDVSFRNSEIIVYNEQTLGLSSYQLLDVVGIVEHEGKTYFLTPTKLYENIGSDDDGANIDAHITTGYIDFNTNELKRFPTGSMYISYDSDNTGTLTLYNSTNGVDDTDYYDVVISSTYPEYFRPQLWDGMKARYWKFKLSNTSGADFRLEDWNVNFYPTKRKVK